MNSYTKNLSVNRVTPKQCQVSIIGKEKGYLYGIQEEPYTVWCTDGTQENDCLMIEQGRIIEEATSVPALLWAVPSNPKTKQASSGLWAVERVGLAPRDPTPCLATVRKCFVFYGNFQSFSSLPPDMDHSSTPFMGPHVLLHTPPAL
ncbi:hypothetical protein ACLOJK_013745 [Asimina triloba]